MRARRVFTAAVAALLVGAGGCAAYRTAAPPAGARFELLQARRLGAFSQRLDAERHAGQADAWTGVGEAWIALATCRPVEAPPASVAADPLAAFVHAGLRVEALRRDRVRAGRASSLAGTLPGRLATPGFFELAAGEVPEGWIVWPDEEERWVDELPGPRAPETDCGEDVEVEVATLEDELVAVDRALAAAEALPGEVRGGSVARLFWRLRLHGARLEEAIRPDDPRPIVARLGAITPAPEGLSDAELAAAHLLRAVHRLKAGEGALADADLERAFALGLEGENLWLGRALRLRRLVEAGRPREAVVQLSALPPEGSLHRTRHAWWLSRAHLATGRDDRFLALASDVLRSGRAADPVAIDLYRRSLEILAEVPFDPRVVAVVESLGPPAGLHLRLYDLAETALDRGRPETAQAVAGWLLKNHRNARHRHRYHAALALAAFQQNDTGQFRRVVRALVHRDAGVVSALPPRRLARFHADADRALAAVLRRLVPQVAEWPVGSARRRRWLALVVEEVGAFLRDDSPTVARRDLSDLHRLAATMLETEPRGYAARVGRDVKRPLVLGRVRVPEEPAGPPLTHDRVWMPPPTSLALIPADGLPPARWATDFEEGGS